MLVVDFRIPNPVPEQVNRQETQTEKVLVRVLGMEWNI